jgi:hypothetical protein
MNASRQELPGQLSPRQAAAAVCPSCGSGLSADAGWCAACHFTGSDTMLLFPDPPPPLMPLFDAASIWNPDDVKTIETAREKLHRRFPQFHFQVCTVMLPAEMKLPVFGFWLLNVSPLDENETEEDRAWTVLLLINANTGDAAVIPGYAAERWLSDDDWETALSSMLKAWRSGKSATAVARFFETSAAFLEHAWKKLGDSVMLFVLRKPGPRRFPAPHPPRRLGAPHAGGNHAVADLGSPAPAAEP